jgi:hypothetical protein
MYELSKVTQIARTALIWLVIVSIVLVAVSVCVGCDAPYEPTGEETGDSPQPTPSLNRAVIQNYIDKYTGQR